MSSTPRQIIEIKIEWTDAGQSQPILVSNYRNVGLTAVGTGSISVLGSKSKPSGGSNGSEEIDFTSPSTIDNAYAQVAIYDETVTTNNWVTAITVAGSTKLAEVDINELSWICLTRTADTVDATVIVSDNQ